MGQLNYRAGLFRNSLLFVGICIFAFIASGTIVPDNTTIVGDLTVQSTNGIDVNPGSDADTDLISIGVTGSPKIKWNETQDAIQLIEKLILGTNAILSKTVNGSAYTSKMSLDTDTTTDSGGIDITRHGDSDASYGSISLLRSRGTHASPTIVQSGDLISSIVGLGYDGVDYEPVSSIEMYSDETPGSNDMPGRIDFKTVSDGSRVLNQVMRIGRRSDVMIGTTTSDSSSILEVQSVTKGSRPFPRMAQTQRDAIVSPATGLSIFNNDFNTFDFYNGSSWLSLLGTTTTQEFSGKTVSGSLKFKESGGGSNYIGFQAPASLTGDVTFTLPDGDGTAGQALKTDGAGTLEWGDAAASGGGGINYISNYDAETDTTGYATYADAVGTSPVDGTGGSANSTWTRSTSSPLRDDASFVFTHNSGASRKGEGVSYDFTIDTSDKAKVLQIEFDYLISSGTFVAGSSGVDSDLTVWVYDVTNATLIQPSSYKLFSNSTTIADKFQATFQSASNSTSYRLIVHCGSTSTSAFTVQFDNFKVGPSNYVFGTPTTDWQAVTPTFTGLGTVTAIEVYSRRNGDSLEIAGNFTTGTTTGVEARISLKYRGVDVTSTAIPSIRKAGDLSFSTSAAVSGNTLIEPSVAYLTLGSQSASNAGLTKILGSVLGSSQKHSFTASVPIVGWSSSVQTSDSTDTRVITARAYRSGNQSVSTAAETDIVFNATSVDDVSGFNTSTGVYTVQTAGKYRVKTSLYITSAASEVFTISIYKTGAQVAQRFFTATPDAMIEVSDVLNCVSGDTIKSTIDSTADTSYTIIGSSVATFTTIERISGPSAIAATESVSFSANTSTTAATTSTPFIYTVEDHDSHGAFSTSTGKFTAPIQGTYHFSFNNYTGATAAQAKLYKNGTAIYTGSSSIANTSVGSGSYTLRLIAGDVIEVRPETTATASLGASFNTFSGFRIGN